MKKLVVYFSATGTTKTLAKNLAESIGADVFEIIPKIPYTSNDLDWTNKNSRSSIEMKNLNFRPEIENKIENIDQYDKIFVGFPIWWYIAPTIINTFMEQYDLSNKTIIPFATSGGSNMGKTNEMLKPSCNGNLVEGKRFSVMTNKEQLKKWAEQF